MQDSVIASLAILKVNWDEGRDYIDNFVPFVAECLRRAPHPEVSLPDLQAALVQHFGFRIPQGALRTILGRAAKRGFVTRGAGIYRRNDRALRGLDLAQTRANVLRQYEGLINKFVDYCRTRHSVTWTTEDADAALLAYLNERSTPILSAAVEGTPIPKATRSVPHAEFLTNSFIANLYASDPEGFNFLEAIVKGSMLANVLLLPDLGSVTRKFGRIEVYFDTPFLLRALGYAGSSRQPPCLELVNLLYEQNVDLRVFEHTLDEMYRVLDAAARAIRGRRSFRLPAGPTLEHFVESGYSSSDVELLIARLPKALRAIHVYPTPKPSHTIPLGLDEEKLAALPRDRIPYRSEEPLRHDLDALTAIHRVREGQTTHYIESCGALFVTTNSSLALLSGNFFRDEYSGPTVPLCILDHVLATIAWLKTPLRIPDLPRKQIIADCYAAMRPPDGLWRVYLQEIDKLEKSGHITQEDYYLLRVSTEARAALMDVTLGRQEAFTEGTVQEVLDASRAAVRAELEESLGKEVEKRIEAEQLAAEATASSLAKYDTQLGRVRTAAAEVGKWAARATLGLGLAVFCIGAYATLPAPFPPVGPDWKQLVLPLLLAAIAIFGVCNMAFGASLRGVARRLEVGVTGFVERQLRRLIDD
jgi:hypothetical protein